jgi:hypothetical protein
VSWFGLHIRWPLTEDVHGHPYHLSANDDGRMFPQVNDCIRTAAPQSIQVKQQARQ